jgi:hypothetical protein
MAVCEVCGNDYDKAFTIQMDGSRHVFDSFENLFCGWMRYQHERSD